MGGTAALSLDDIVLSTYCALDDALQHAGICARNGKLIPRRGGAPDVDDREILCLAVLQELLGFESDNAFYLWLSQNPTMQSNFPRRLTRQNYADRRALLTPLIEKICGAFCDLDGEGDPPFSSSTRTLSTSAVSFAQAAKPASTVWHKPATAMPCACGSTASGNT